MKLHIIKSGERTSSFTPLTLILSLLIILTTLPFIQVNAKEANHNGFLFGEKSLLNPDTQQLARNFKYTFPYNIGDWYERGTRAAIFNENIQGALGDVFLGLSPKDGVGDIFVALTKRRKGLTTLNMRTFNVTLAVVHGQVTDTIGKPIGGVSVSVVGSKKGTITDNEGKFSLDVQEGDVLQFSSVGYRTKTFTVGNKTEINVQLESVSSSLNDVVVVAYGSQKKTNLTGSVVQIKGDEVAKSPVGSVVNALQGRLPGLTFVQNNGQPGYDAAAIKIRGFGTALVVIDGVPSDFSQLDPNEIETISVLKDGAAAIYGFKAANGAIIVTTKKGKVGSPKITFNGFYGRQSITRYPKMVNGAQFVELIDESQVNQNLPLAYGKDELSKWQNGTDSGYQSTDWQGLLLRKQAPMISSNVNVSGGTEAVKYFFSLGYLDQQGLLATKDNWFKRYNLRSNISAKISNRLTAELNIGGRYENRYNPAASFYTIWGAIERTYPTVAPYVNNNTDYLNNTNTVTNGVALANTSLSGYNSNDLRVFTGQGVLTYQIPGIKGLNAKVLYSYESDNSNRKVFTKQYSLYNYNAATQSYNIAYQSGTSNINLATSQASNTDLQFSLNYDHSFGDHHITGLFLAEKQKAIGLNYGLTRYYDLDVLDQLPTSTTTNQSINTGSAPQSAYQGVAGRINYNFKEKYLLDAAVRYSYTYKNPNTPRYFPSVSVGWNINKESFFQVPAISNLKVRASWAIIAEDANLAEFNYLSLYAYPSGSYIFSNGTITNGLSLSHYANPDLTFDEAHTYNIGLDFGFFNNVLTGSFDVFYRERTGLPYVSSASLPSTIGVSAPQININTDNTRGYELQLGFNQKMGDLILNISSNLAYTRSKNGFLVQNKDYFSSANANYQGNYTERWSDLIWGYKAVGQFQNQQEINSWAIQDNNANTTLRPGDVKYLDLNKDGVVDSRDVTVIGKGLDGSGAARPAYSYGLSINATYKDFDLSAVFAGAAGFDILYNNELVDPFFNNASAFAYLTDRWHHEDIYDPNSPWVPGKFPSTIVNGSNNNNGVLSDGSGTYKYRTSFWMENAAYVRLKTIQVGYTIPAKITSRINIKKVRCYISAENLLTITGVSYLDPEASSTSRGNYYPQQKVIAFGVNVQF